MRADFKLFARLLVDVRTTVHGETFKPRGQRNRAANIRPRALGGIHNFTHRSVEHSVIKRLEAYADYLCFHGLSPFHSSKAQLSDGLSGPPGSFRHEAV